MKSQAYEVSRLTARADAYKTLRCKPGFEQRGAVCQPEGTGKQILTGKDKLKSFAKVAGIAAAGGLGAAILLNQRSKKGPKESLPRFLPFDTSPKAALPESKGKPSKKQTEVIKNGVLIASGSKVEEKESPLLTRQREILESRNALINNIAKNTNATRNDSEKMARSLRAFTELGFTYDNIRDAEKEGSAYFVKGYDDKERIDTVKEINSFLDKAPKHDGTVYRGISIKESALDGYLKQIQGDGLVLKAMSSFSKDPKIGDGYAKADREAENKKVSIVLVSTKNKSGVDIEEYSEAPREKEVLVPAGTFYRASKVEIKKGMKGRSVYYVHVDEIAPDKQKNRRDQK